MANFREEEGIYLNKIREYKESDSKTIDDFNNTLYDYYREELNLYEKFAKQTVDNKVINSFNSEVDDSLKADINFSMTYRILSYIVKTELEFDIDSFVNKENFLNVIKCQVLYHSKRLKHRHEAYSKEDKLKEAIRQTRILLDNLIEILYSYSNFIEKRVGFSDDTKKLFNIMIDLLDNHYKAISSTITYSPISDLDLDKLREKAEIMISDSENEVEEVETIITIPKPIENIIPVVIEEPKESKWDYDDITEKLSPFINGGSLKRYKSIIEKHKLPDNDQPLKMISGFKADIIRFADCFEIPISKVNKMFQLTVKRNNEDKVSVNDLLRALRLFNKDLYK